MIQFTAIIKRFGKQGEKTGWTYIEIPVAIATQLQPGNKKGFRAKGKFDDYKFSMLALLPMGGGDFIMTLNATTRKGIKKPVGAIIQVKMEVDDGEIKPPEELLECLQDEPGSFAYFKSLAKGHQNYFSNWVRSAKTEPTKTKRIAAILNAFDKKWDFGQMIRAMKKEKIG
jgi:hypothetical protein